MIKPTYTTNNNLDIVFETDSIIDEETIFERYIFEKKLTSAVISGNYDQALLIFNDGKNQINNLADLKARIPDDPDRLYRNLAWMMNSMLRICLLTAQVPVTYIHIVATHFGILIKSVPVELIKNQSLYRHMIQIYCYTAKNFNTGQYSKIVEEITNYISFNLQKEMTLNQIARNFNFTPTYINRLLKKETGYSTIKYIKTQRITLAKMLLHFDDMPISEIAYTVGYPDCNYFCRIFKQMEKISPLQYKNQIKNNAKNDWYYQNS